MFLIPASVPRLERKRNVLFNDALNTFIFTGMLCGVGHMVKDHSASERGNPLPPHGLLFPINSKGSFICTHRTMSERSYHGTTSRSSTTGLIVYCI